MSVESPIVKEEPNGKTEENSITVIINTDGIRTGISSKISREILDAVKPRRIVANDDLQNQIHALEIYKFLADGFMNAFKIHFEKQSVIEGGKINERKN